MERKLETVRIGSMYSRVYIPPGPGPHPVLMLLHGWTGDENSMWVFSSHLPQDHIMVAPRGLYSSPLGGYSWQPNSQRKWPEIDDFRPAIEALLIVQDQNQIATGDFSKISLVGFSQGAAIVEDVPLAAYTFDLVGAHPRTDATEKEIFYKDIVNRIVTAASTKEVTDHKVVGDPIPYQVWVGLETPEDMREAGRELGRRQFFTEMVRVANL